MVLVFEWTNIIFNLTFQKFDNFIEFCLLANFKIKCVQTYKNQWNHWTNFICTKQIITLIPAPFCMTVYFHILLGQSWQNLRLCCRILQCTRRPDNCLHTNQWWLFWEPSSPSCHHHLLSLMLEEPYLCLDYLSNQYVLCIKKSEIFFHVH